MHHLIVTQCYIKMNNILFLTHVQSIVYYFTKLNIYSEIKFKSQEKF